MSNIVLDYSKETHIKNDRKLYNILREISRNLSISVNKIDMTHKKKSAFYCMNITIQM